MPKKIAMLIIHGIGEQDPFETLDVFVRSFLKIYVRDLEIRYP